jgi:MFS family permease
MSDQVPTNIRRRIIIVSMAMAFILYLDRVCLAEIVKSASFNTEVGISKEEIGVLLGSFFLAYAIFQVPAGWISDRFGARAMLTSYIVLWSVFTALTGAVSSFPALLAMRLLCGAAEAGAYPASNAIIRRWIPPSNRARASSFVTVGGRIGGTLAPFITAWMVVAIGYWRPVLWIDGAVGLVVAFLYWRVVRNRPSEHPECNEAERALIGIPPVEAPPSLRDLGLTLRAFCRSRNLWLLASVGFLVNVGWAFLITWLPTYLKEAHRVEPVAGGRMVTLVLACGMIGQLTGGWLTDWSTRTFGPRWGRVVPLTTSGLLAGSAYVVCLYMNSAWAIVACCGLVSFAVDMGNPATWAVMQDIGGRVTAATAGWANMWGNFGAALTGFMVPTLASIAKTNEAGQNLVFLVCGGALATSGLLALGLNATKPVVADSSRVVSVAKAVSPMP